MICDLGVEPSRYAITLDVDLDKFVFSGQETIDIHVDPSLSPLTTSVQLHSKEISILQASYDSKGENTQHLEASSISYDLKSNVVTIDFGSPLISGDGTLTLKFTGILNNQMAGFYRSQYETIDGQKRFMASTQLEALDARRCFPCWDEPARKAVFEITMIVPKDRDVLSNMPEASVNTIGENKKKVVFMPSPKMSTYLVAMCVGEFDFVSGLTKHGVLIRVFTPPGKGHLGTFALKTALDTLDLYDDFFKIPYPLPKLDMIAIPEFAMGAMENWGLVTYREVDLLIDEIKASSSQRQRVGTVVTHELAHQWFGNLVTMEWWQALYLNEGFASWLQTWSSDVLYPDWQMWDQFTTDDQKGALHLDALRTSHPIEVPIKHAEEVEQVFDAISYCKGACIVHMVRAVLGDELFQKGLQVYMDRHKYSNTETSDLWQAWEDVSQKPVSKMMSSWTEQMGYPILEVTSQSWADGYLTLNVRQSWFLADGSCTEKEKESKLWTIPLVARASGQSESTPMKLMSTRDDVLKIRAEQPKSWVKLNYQQPTLMRVLYPESMLLSLRAAIASQALPAVDRVGLLSDTYALVKAGNLSPDVLIGLLPAYLSERNSTVWEELSAVIGAIDKLTEDNTELNERFQELVRKLIEPCAKEVGWNPKSGDGHLGKMLRGTMISLLCTYSSKSQEVQTEARTRFTAAYADPNDITSLPADFKTPVYCLVLKTGGKTEFDQIMDIYRRAETNMDRKYVYASIGYASSAALKSQVLQWALDDVLLQDFFYPMSGVSLSNVQGRTLTFEFFKEHFPQISRKLETASPSLMNGVIKICCGRFTDHAHADEIEEFFKAHPVPQCSRAISQTLEAMRASANFSDRLAKSDLKNAQFWDNLWWP